MLFVPFVFSKSRFQGPAFRCNKILVIVTLLEAIEGIPDKDYNFWGNENFHNLYERLFQERKLKGRNLEKCIYERPLHLRVNLLSGIKANIHVFQNHMYLYLNDQSLVKREFIILRNKFLRRLKPGSQEQE